MSWLGASLSVNKDAMNAAPASAETDDGGDDMSTARQDLLMEDVHPPPTPPGGVESLFLSGLLTQTISASALAQQIHQRHRPLSLAGTSIATDDFLSANDAPNSSSLLESDDEDNDDTPFGNDALIHTREAIPSEIMPESKTTTEPCTGDKLDPAEKIYGTAKSVWGWGKGVIIFSPFLGLAEGIAGKVVETAGSNLKELDSAVVEKLHGLDDGILNPAIGAILGTILGAKKRTENFVMPIISKVLSPFGLLKDKPEHESKLKPDGTVKPELALTE